ncbi:hypothetical protein F5876DRAFT_71289 [Lentinula aff. lateritia]|uniref:Uncharacterized protein n=1 Tax=Lentinula aff. lateritia TaxID=2804960 RepID=A0ACC1TFX5_9AGAR|nr:hypothetical protein F5876DRAFT_71289 [Lentinula aff. lateritia]
MRRGRAIPKLITAYETIHTLLAQYDEYRQKGYHLGDFEEDDDDIDEEKCAEELEEKRRGANSARSFDTSMVMNFVGEALNKEVQKINQTRLKEYQIKLHAHADRVTGSDNLTDLPAATSPEPVLEHIEEFHTSSRDSRGLQNDITGCLLCPVEFDWKDPIVHAAVRTFNSKYNFASSAHAHCFYKDKEFDLDDLDKGFLQSYLLIQVYRLMFTSPSSTKDQPQDVENLPASKKKKTTAINCHGNIAQIILST